MKRIAILIFLIAVYARAQMPLVVPVTHAWLNTNAAPPPNWISLSWTPVKHYSLTCAKLTKPSALLMTRSQTNCPTQIYNQIYESTDLLNWQFYEACPNSVTSMLVPNIGLPIQVFKFGISYRAPID
jgi:hypothetical protein